MERTLNDLMVKGRLRSIPRPPNTEQKERKESAPKLRKASTGDNKGKREKVSNSLRKNVPSVKSNVGSEDGSHSSLNTKFGNAAKRSLSKNKIPKKTAERSDSAYRYMNGPFSRLEAIKEKGQVNESPFLRTDGSRGPKNHKTMVQNGNNLVRIMNKPPIATRTDRKPQTQNTVNLKLVDASPYGIADFKSLVPKGIFKEGRPPVVPTADRSNSELNELYEKKEFYEFKAFFEIEESGDPFANVEDKEDNFTIDVASFDLVSRAEYQ
jgi:hypothetical protein